MIYKSINNLRGFFVVGLYKTEITCFCCIEKEDSCFCFEWQIYLTAYSAILSTEEEFAGLDRGEEDFLN